MSEEKFHREDEQFDELFRGSLGEMSPEPSAGVWNKLNQQLFRSEILRFNFTNLPKAYWGIIPAAVIITGIALYLGVSENNSTPELPTVEETITLVQEEPLQNEAKEDISVIDATSITNEITVIDANSVTNDVNGSGMEHPAAAAAIVNTSPATPTTPITLTTLTTLTPLGGNYPEPLLSGTMIPPDIQSVTNPVPKETTLESSHKPLSRSLDMGLNITPDMVFYNNSSGSFKYNYTFDLGARYNLGRFYIQSGAGLTYSTDVGDYAISYLNNDSVGFYYTVNSFSVDPGNPEDPQFETKQVTVYDSVLYLYDYSTKNKYYYIQIPLNVGYRIIDKPVWRLSVEAGLLYSYLVSIDEPAPTFYVPEGRILTIERNTPKRNNHSLGITGGVSVEYQFTRNFYLLIEPTFKYYVQAIEENSSRGDKQPYSIGLRAGIWYRLNFKNRTR